MTNALVPEFTVRDWRASVAFYVDVLGFTLAYRLEEDGFALLTLGEAELMIDALDLGRTYGPPYRPEEPPFGRGLNVQIRVDAVAPLLLALERAGVTPFAPVEEVWYRDPEGEHGHRQFVVADPDGYLLRFYEDLGKRPPQT